MKALPKILLALTGVAALSLAYPASVQAVPTTYQYTGNPFTDVSGPYTTSDFVTAMITLAGPLGANMPLTEVSPIAFTLSDGVQTITNIDPILFLHLKFATDATGSIRLWQVAVLTFPNRTIGTTRTTSAFDLAATVFPPGFGENFRSPGVWNGRPTVPDAGSTLSLMTLTLTALGLAARQFQRAAT